MTTSSQLASRCRDRFGILGRQVYVNSCAQGALSDEVRAAYETYLADWDEHGSPWDIWVGKLEQARAGFAALVAAPPDEVAVTTSVSAAVSSVASGLDFSQRPKGRSHRPRVPDDRADLACAGASRRPRRAPCAGRRRARAARALRRGDRRADRDRVGLTRFLPHRGAR